MLILAVLVVRGLLLTAAVNIQTTTRIYDVPAGKFVLSQNTIMHVEVRGTFTYAPNTGCITLVRQGALGHAVHAVQQVRRVLDEAAHALYTAGGNSVKHTRNKYRAYEAGESSSAKCGVLTCTKQVKI